MNLPVETSELPPPSPEQPDVLLEQWAKQQPQPRSSHYPPPKVIGILVAILVGVGVLGVVSNSDDESTSASPGTGNVSVDNQIVDAVWDSMKGELCPAFQTAKASLPSMSEGEVYDMGVGMADMGEMTPAQLARLRELALADC